MQAHCHELAQQPQQKRALRRRDVVELDTKCLAQYDVQIMKDDLPHAQERGPSAAARGRAADCFLVNDIPDPAEQHSGEQTA